jgi:(E)-4-hydroxy-3-methylbut-2-enyl-diphosphate synthase
MDTEATVRQGMQLADAGCELVRITARDVREAANLAKIKDELLKRGYDLPLIADIHFNPKAAEVAAGIVEKVRINPGNYVDKRVKKHYSDREYREEIARIRERMGPLVSVCRQHKTALRIGSNHGSLSNRILNRFGNTSRGMVEAALEFVRICRELDYHDLVLSMKSSHVRIMIEATRLLVRRMQEEGMDYPIHLGMTEAGEGMDGRVRSAAGIGPLLMEGIGDTLRVSLTEDPVKEIPVARLLASRYPRHRLSNRKPLESIVVPGRDQTIFPVRPPTELPVETWPVVVLSASGLLRDAVVQKSGQPLPDLVFLPAHNDKSLPVSGYFAAPEIYGNPASVKIPLLDAGEYVRMTQTIPGPLFIHYHPGLHNGIWPALKTRLKEERSANLVVETGDDSEHAAVREVFMDLHREDIPARVILKKIYEKVTAEELIVYASAELSSLLVDGLGDGIWIETKEATSPVQLVLLSYNLLQVHGARISMPEYIACPSCGRTLFDIQKVLLEIKDKTRHLKGIKIAVMGCIVNGPGEIADADYGYIGAGPGRISLYKGSRIVRKNIPEEKALEELLGLIGKDMKTTRDHE